MSNYTKTLDEHKKGWKESKEAKMATKRISFSVEEMYQSVSYSDILEAALNCLGSVQGLRLKYESDSSEFVDIDVLSENGRVFSYRCGVSQIAYILDQVTNKPKVV